MLKYTSFLAMELNVHEVGAEIFNVPLACRECSNVNLK